MSNRNGHPVGSLSKTRRNHKKSRTRKSGSASDQLPVLSPLQELHSKVNFIIDGQSSGSDQPQLSWQNLCAVRKFVSMEDESELQCPISLCELSAPMITSCGHIFSATSLLRLFNQNESCRCPLCSQVILKEQIRPVRIEIVAPLRPGFEGVFRLLSTAVEPEDPLFSPQQIVSEEFLRELLQSHLSALHVEENELVQEPCSDGTQTYSTALAPPVPEPPIREDPFSRIVIKEAQAFLNHWFARWLDTCQCLGSTPPPLLETHDSRHFYQLSDGQPVFLHHFSFKQLKHEYSANLPSFVSGKIEALSSHVVTPELQKRINFLNRIPIATKVWFAEVDLSPLLSSQTVAFFAREVSQNRSRRAAAAKAGDRDRVQARKQQERRTRADQHPEPFMSSYPVQYNEEQLVREAIRLSALEHQMLTLSTHEEVSRPPRAPDSFSFAQIAGWQVSENVRQFPALGSRSQESSEDQTPKLNGPHVNTKRKQKKKKWKNAANCPIE